MNPEEQALYEFLTRPLIDQALYNGDLERVRNLRNGTFEDIVDQRDIELSSLWYDHPNTSFFKEAEIIELNHPITVTDTEGLNPKELKIPLFHYRGKLYNQFELGRMIGYRIYSFRYLFKCVESYTEQIIEALQRYPDVEMSVEDFIVGFWDRIQDEIGFPVITDLTDTDREYEIKLRDIAPTLKRTYSELLMIKRELTSYAIGLYSRKIAKTPTK